MQGQRPAPLQRRILSPRRRGAGQDASPEAFHGLRLCAADKALSCINAERDRGADLLEYVRVQFADLRDETRDRDGFHLEAVGRRFLLQSVALTGLELDQPRDSCIPALSAGDRDDDSREQASDRWRVDDHGGARLSHFGALDRIKSD